MKENEEKYFDLICFLKKLFDVFDGGDYVFLIKNKGLLDEKLIFFIKSFDSIEKVSFGLKFVLLFINIFMLGVVICRSFLIKELILRLLCLSILFWILKKWH